MLVRRGHVDDAVQVRALRLEALRLAPNLFGANVRDVKARPDGFWRDFAAGDTSRAMFVADEGHGALAGIAGVMMRDGATDAQFGALWVTPRARGLGLGRQLYDVRERWSSAAGAEAVTVRTSTENQPMQALLATAGYEIVDNVPWPEGVLRPGRLLVYRKSLR
jgi:GNAT superfamily N-acetyltransferase